MVITTKKVSFVLTHNQIIRGERIRLNKVSFQTSFRGGFPGRVLYCFCFTSAFPVLKHCLFELLLASKQLQNPKKTTSYCHNGKKKKRYTVFFRSHRHGLRKRVFEEFDMLCYLILLFKWFFKPWALLKYLLGFIFYFVLGFLKQI